MLTGAPLVLIAGQGATSSVWTPDLLRGLAQNREVIPFDNMGIGLSTFFSSTDADYSGAAYAAHTADLIEALGLVQPAVLGWSLGASIALRIEAQYPGTFSRMVVSGQLQAMANVFESLCSRQGAACKIRQAHTDKITLTPLPPAGIGIFMHVPARMCRG